MSRDGERQRGGTTAGQQQRRTERERMESANVHLIWIWLSDGAFRKPGDHKVGMRPFKVEAHLIIRAAFGHSKLYHNVGVWPFKAWPFKWEATFLPRPAPKKTKSL